MQCIICNVINIQNINSEMKTGFRNHPYSKLEHNLFYTRAEFFEVLHCLCMDMVTTAKPNVERK